MRLFLAIILVTGFVVDTIAQNCNAYLYVGNTLQYEACQIAEERAGWYQFTWEYRDALERAVDHCPYFSHGYRPMSVAYLKSGDFINWEKLMDKAVHLEPMEHLGYRGWCRNQFFRDYEGAIADIERLDSLTRYEIGYSASGAYHLHIAQGLCYKAIGQSAKAIKVMENQLSVAEYTAGSFDHLHLGVLYFDNDRLDDALEQFEIQINNNDLADCRYYYAMTLKAMGKAYQNSLIIAKELYLADRRMFDGYTHQMDKVYLRDIELTIAESN